MDAGVNVELVRRTAAAIRGAPGGFRPDRMPGDAGGARGVSWWAARTHLGEQVFARLLAGCTSVRERDTAIHDTAMQALRLNPWQRDALFTPLWPVGWFRAAGVPLTDPGDPDPLYDTPDHEGAALILEAVADAEEAGRSWL